MPRGTSRGRRTPVTSPWGCSRAFIRGRRPPTWPTARGSTPEPVATSHRERRCPHPSPPWRGSRNAPAHRSRCRHHRWRNQRRHGGGARRRGHLGQHRGDRGGEPDLRFREPVQHPPPLPRLRGKPVPRRPHSGTRLQERPVPVHVGGRPRDALGGHDSPVFAGGLPGEEPLRRRPRLADLLRGSRPLLPGGGRADRGGRRAGARRIRPALRRLPDGTAADLLQPDAREGVGGELGDPLLAEPGFQELAPLAGAA